MDDNGNHMLDVDDFRWGLIDYGISITKEEAVMVLDHFDRDKNGQVDFNEFLRALRVSFIKNEYILQGDLNNSRRGWVKKAYDKLDVNKDGRVTLEDIAQLYDASYHPDVQ